MFPSAEYVPSDQPGTVLNTIDTLPRRRRVAAAAITITSLMAAMFLFLGLEARAHDGAPKITTPATIRVNASR